MNVFGRPISLPTLAQEQLFAFSVRANFTAASRNLTKQFPKTVWAEVYGEIESSGAAYVPTHPPVRFKSLTIG